MSTNKSISTDFYQYGEQDNVSIVTCKEQMIGEFNDAFDSINISEDGQTADTDYVLSVMGKEAGRIIIPTDRFIKDAFYNNETKEITLVVSIGNDSTKEIKFSVKDLVDIYTGDNLTIEVKNNVISLSESIKTQLSDFSRKIDEVENKIPSLEDYATEEWVEDKNYLTEHQDISGKADKVDVYTKDETYSKAEIDSKGYLTEHQDISAKADKADVYTKAETYSKDEIDSKGYLTEHQDISGKLDVTAYTPTDLTNYYTKKETDDAIASVDVTSQLADYATMQWVENKNYLTEHQDISGKADKVDVYTKEETYSKGEIDSKGYLTEHQDISGIVDGINSAISSEVERATIAENDINRSLSSEIERSIKKDDALTNSIVEEISRATSAETDNANSISTIESFFDNGASKSALKLKTAHKMWGNNFDGTQDISGDIVLPKEQRIIIGGATLSWDEEKQALKIDGNLILNGEIITNNV